MNAANHRVEQEKPHLFAPGHLGSMNVLNRLVRSATWDPKMILQREVDDVTLERYRSLAIGDIGAIIVGDFGVVPRGLQDRDMMASYDHVRVHGYRKLVKTVKATNPHTRIVAQLSASIPKAGPSAVPSLLTSRMPRELTRDEIRQLPHLFATAIEGVKDDGFDGAQLHACHGGLLSQFLSPYTNRRRDEYGGDSHSRCRLLAEILDAARELVGDFPILIKLNGTDDVEGGIDQRTVVKQAVLLAEAGFDAIEVSGSLKDALARPEAELGFPPILSPESRTAISAAKDQSYYLHAARAIRQAIDIPVILVGGNRHRDRLDALVRAGDVDFIAMSRPFICEPLLAKRWAAREGSAHAACISCNACIYDMYTNGRVRCLVREEPELLEQASRWLGDWAKAVMRQAQNSAQEASQHD